MPHATAVPLCPAAGCAALHECFCTADEHCGAGHECVPGHEFPEYRVCAPLQPQPKHEL
jgi:L-gulonolactone oxidase